MSRIDAPLMTFDQHQGVFYVDAQRNMAVTMGERDVKTDVKEKSRFYFGCLVFYLDNDLIGSGETSICPPPCWRETLRSLTLLR